MLYFKMMYQFAICDEHCRGKIHYKHMYDMLRDMDPPVGFGNKCPSRLAYKKLIRMNMPIDDQGQVRLFICLYHGIIIYILISSRYFVVGYFVVNHILELESKLMRLHYERTSYNLVTCSVTDQ